MNVIVKALHGVENPFVVDPSLELPGNLRSGRALIHHHIGVIAQAPQGIHPVQVLLMSAAVVGEDIGPPSPVAFDVRQLHKAAEIGRQVGVGVIPCEMHRFCPYFVQQRHVVRRCQADVQALGEVHPCAALRQLCQQPLVVLTGQQIRVQKFDLPLSMPKLGQVGHLTADPPLLPADNAESA